MTQFLVFPSEDDFESVTPSDVLDGAALEAVLTHTFSDPGIPIATPPVYDFLEACACGCGERIRGKQKFASTACQVRVWRAEHPKALEVRRPEVSICQACLGWTLGNGEAFICESCADSDAERSRTCYAPLLRLAPRADNRDVMVYIGTGNYLTYRRGDEHEIVALDEPLIDALVEVLGGRREGAKRFVPTAALVAEAERQAETRGGNLSPRTTGPVPPSEKDAEAHAAVVRDREVWGTQVSATLLARQSTASKEHNERTKAKYAVLAHECPELFE